MRLTALALLCLPTAVLAETFPHEAIVQVAATPVRCGPGDRFYETARLPAGSRVTVHRHDPGGWRMIAPPPGSFSLVRVEEVRPDGTGRLEVLGADVSVRVGSRLGSGLDVEQLRMTTGDRLTPVAGVAAPAGWVAVLPPRGEYRWIAGQSLVPATPAKAPARETDPFADPVGVADLPPASPAAMPQPHSPKLDATEQTTPEFLPPTAAATGPPPADSLTAIDVALDALDMVEPTDWPLDQLAARCNRLAETDPVGLTRSVSARLSRIERMRMVKTHYASYVRLTDATDHRDAELLAKRDAVMPAPSPEPSLTTPMAEPATMPPTAGGPPLARLASGPAERPVPGAMPTEVMPTGPGPAEPVPTNAIAAGAAAAGVPSPAAEQAGTNAPHAPGGPPTDGPATAPRRFDAVGFIRPANDPRPETPPFVLVDANGRIVAYLTAEPGIELDQFVGQPLGVDGSRMRHPEIPTPLIIVRQLTPVRL